MHSANISSTQSKKWHLLNACGLINFILEDLSKHCQDQERTKVSLKELERIILHPNTIEESVYYTSYEASNKVSLLPQHTIDRLINYLLHSGSDYYSSSMRNCFLAFFKNVLVDHEFISYMIKYRYDTFDMGHAIAAFYFLNEQSTLLESILDRWISLTYSHKANAAQIIDSAKTMFNCVNDKNINTPADESFASILRCELNAFDKRDNLIKSVLPIQGLIASRSRIKEHYKHYKSTYQNEIYTPTLMSADIEKKIKVQLNKVNFIPSLMHITNVTYLNQLLDSCIFSRKQLERDKTSFFKAALNPALEPADYDAVCFGIQDVDHLALQNADQDHLPARIMIDFKKLLQQRSCISGQMFIKEHDLSWSSKPNSENGCDFATADIPKEFSQPIALGDIQIKLYRNALGMKLMINENKYILHYPQKLGWGVNYYHNPQSQESRSENHIEEEVISSSFGETIFYGDVQDTEKFFVMQFFRHIEKMSKLSNIIYQELSKASDKEILQFLNEVGTRLSSGAEFNFQRGFYVPIDSIKQIEVLSHFNIKISKNNPHRSSVYYGCKQFFSDPEFKPIIIKMEDLLNLIKNDEYHQLMMIKASCPILFKSIRFIRYLLKAATSNTATYQFLTNSFHILIDKNKEETSMQNMQLG